MPRYKTILAATDLSAGSDEAVLQADQLAKAHGAHLIAFHSVPFLTSVNMVFPHFNVPDATAVPEVMIAAGDALAARVTDLTGRSPDDFQVFVDPGAGPDSGILRQAEELDVDLIVVGSRPREQSAALSAGHVAQRVVRYAHCDVLVARASSAAGVVIAATDFSDPALPAIATAVDEAKSRGARLVVMHSLGIPAADATKSRYAPTREQIQTASSHAMDRLGESLAQFGVEGERRVSPGRAEDEILRAAEELGAQLIVVGGLGRTGLSRVALGSVAEAVSQQAHCSVLVVRFKNVPFQGQ